VFSRSSTTSQEVTARTVTSREQLDGGTKRKEEEEKKEEREKGKRKTNQPTTVRLPRPSVARAGKRDGRSSVEIKWLVVERII
jgi:hypothetical protein